jgi:SagB-type dehydrogenase family enzyme
MKVGILLSGGIDSIALTYWQRPQIALTVDYGQAPAAAEILAAEEVCKNLSIEHHVIRVDCKALGSGDLANSAPLAMCPLASAKYHYQVGAKHYLSIPRSANDRTFFKIIHGRRTRRLFSEVSDKKLGEFLWHSGKIFASRTLANGRRLQYRCSPSAGAIHPVDILVIDSANDQISLYDPVGHALQSLRGPRAKVRQLQEVARGMVDPGAGRIFWFAAEFGRTLDVYQGGESLVWRDAGALVATFCYVAEALELNCCPLGSSGEPFISQFLNSAKMVIGVGGCVVGGKNR